MGRSGTNLPRMADYNQRVILDQIRRSRAGISRVEIASATGLSVQTVSNLVTRLLEAEFVVEGERQAVVRGKPRTNLHVRPGVRYAVGAHIDPIAVTLTLVDLSGQIRERVIRQTPRGPDAVVAVIAAETAKLVATVEADLVLGLGVAAPGPLDTHRGRVIHPPLMQDWGDVPLRDRLQQETALATFLDKDVSAAMMAELWQSEHDLSGTTVFAYLGYGCGFAFARKGELFTGSSGNAGETGHLIVDSAGPLCWCGQRGCIGISSSMDYLVEQGIDRGVLPPFEIDPTAWEIDERMSALAAAAHEGSEAAREILTVAARRVAHGIVLVSDLVDADHVVGGGLNWDRLAPYLRDAAVAEFRSQGTLRELHGVEVDGTGLGVWVGAVGAASLVLDALFTPRPSTLIAATN